MKNLKMIFCLSLLAVVGKAEAMSFAPPAPLFDKTVGTSLYVYSNAQKESNKLENAIYIENAFQDSWFFGRKYATPINFDVDGDGLTNKVVVYADRKKIKWESEAPKAIKNFGSKGHQIITGCDFNGDKKTEMVVYYPKKKQIQYKEFDSEEVKTIKLPKKNYEYITCSSLFKNTEFSLIVAKKQMGSGKNKYWIYDIVSPDSTVLYKDIQFGDAKQGSIVILKAYGDEDREIGYAVNNENKKTDIVMLNDISDISKGVTVFNLDHKVTQTNGTFDISPAEMIDGNSTQSTGKGIWFDIKKGFYYRTSSAFYFYDIDTRTATKLTIVAQGGELAGIKHKKINMVKISELLKIEGASDDEVSTNSVELEPTGIRIRGHR